ncbi:MAG: LptF/LptG family permease [Gemmataceae bacterium]
MFGCILHRMILWELVKVFILSLIGLTGMVLLGGVVTEATQRGLTPVQIMALVPLIIPSTLPYTIPTTTLFAVSLVYGRLAHDNEILAIKAAGVNVLKALTPAVFLGIVMSAVTMGLYYQFIPYTYIMMRGLFLKDVEEVLYTMLKNERCIKHPKLNYAIWVQKVEGRRLVNPYFKRRTPNGMYDLVAHAREAELRVDARNNQVLVHMRYGEVYSEENSTRAYFDDKIWEVPLPPSPFNVMENRRPRELAWNEIEQRRDEIRQEVEEVNAEIALAASRSLLTQAPQHLAQHLESLKFKKFFAERELHSLAIEQQMRPAIAVGCFCFVLVGCPVGIWLSKSDYLSAFITCFLPIVLLYYPLLLCGSNLARDGNIHPALTVWFANVLIVLIAVFLFRRLLKH